jgi:hypothetical protein
MGQFPALEGPQLSAGTSTAQAPASRKASSGQHALALLLYPKHDRPQVSEAMPLAAPLRPGKQEKRTLRLFYGWAPGWLEPL